VETRVAVELDFEGGIGVEVFSAIASLGATFSVGISVCVAVAQLASKIDNTNNDLQNLIIMNLLNDYTVKIHIITYT
jgi:hypothetical protein